MCFWGERAKAGICYTVILLMPLVKVNKFIENTFNC